MRFQSSVFFPCFSLAPCHSTAAMRQPKTPRPLQTLGRTSSVTSPLDLKTFENKNVTYEATKTKEELSTNRKKEALPDDTPRHASTNACRNCLRYRLQRRRSAMRDEPRYAGHRSNLQLKRQNSAGNNEAGATDVPYHRQSTQQLEQDRPLQPQTPGKKRTPQRSRRHEASHGRLRCLHY